MKYELKVKNKVSLDDFKFIGFEPIIDNNFSIKHKHDPLKIESKPKVKSFMRDFVEEVSSSKDPAVFKMLI